MLQDSSDQGLRLSDWRAQGSGFRFRILRVVVPQDPCARVDFGSEDTV